MDIEFISMAFGANPDKDGMADISLVRFLCGYECYCGIFHAEDMAMMLNTINK